MRSEVRSIRLPSTGESSAVTSDSTVIASIRTIRVGLNSSASGTATML